LCWSSVTGFTIWIQTFAISAIFIPLFKCLIATGTIVPVTVSIVIIVITIVIIGIVWRTTTWGWSSITGFTIWIQTFAISAIFVPIIKCLLAAGTIVPITVCIVIVVITVVIFGIVWTTAALCWSSVTGFTIWIQTFAISAIFIPLFKCLIATGTIVPVTVSIVIIVITIVIIGIVWRTTTWGWSSITGFTIWIQTFAISAIFVPIIKCLLAAGTIVPITVCIVIVVITVVIFGIVWTTAALCWSRVASFTIWIQTFAISAILVPIIKHLIAAGTIVPITVCIVIVVIAIVIFGIVWTTAALRWSRVTSFTIWVQTLAISAIFVPLIKCLIATSTVVPITVCIVIFIITVVIICIVWFTT